MIGIKWIYLTQKPKSSLLEIELIIFQALDDNHRQSNYCKNETLYHLTSPNIFIYWSCDAILTQCVLFQVAFGQTVVTEVRTQQCTLIITAKWKIVRRKKSQ